MRRPGAGWIARGLVAALLIGCLPAQAQEVSFKKWISKQQRDYKKASKAADKRLILLKIAAHEDPRVGVVLWGLLGRERSQPMRLAIIQLLANERHVKLTPYLIDLLDDAKDPLEEIELIRTLGGIGDKRAVKPLIGLLKRGSGRFVRARAALRALRAMAAPSSVKPLVQYILSVFPPLPVRIGRSKPEHRDFDWDRFEELKIPILDCAEVLTRTRHDTYEEWREWFNDNKDSFED